MPRGWAGWAVASALAQGKAVASAARMCGNVQSARCLIRTARTPPAAPTSRQQGVHRFACTVKLAALLRSARCVSLPSSGVLASAQHRAGADAQHEAATRRDRYAPIVRIVP